MLSEISPSTRTNIVRFHLYNVLRVVKVIERESKWWLPGAGGGMNGELLFNGQSLLYKMKRIMEMDGGGGTTMRVYLIH